MALEYNILLTPKSTNNIFFNKATHDFRTQSLILHQTLTFEGGLNLRKIEAAGFVTVTLHEPKR